MDAFLNFQFLLWSCEIKPQLARAVTTREEAGLPF